MQTESITATFVQDEDDFDTFASTQNDTELQAATWVCRQRDGLTDHDQQQMMQWLAASPAHAQAFNDMARMLGTICQLPPDMTAALKQNLLPASTVCPPACTVTPLAIPSRKPRQTHHWFPTIAMAASLATGVLVWSYWQQPVFSQHYTTTTASRNVPLPDGSNIMLDAASQLAVNYYRDRREIRLDEGQALFSVQSDNTRPFDVMASHTRVRVLGTRFTVRYVKEGIAADQVAVMVEHGKVAVSSTNTGTASTAYLHAGQAINTQTDGHLQAVYPTPATSIASWRYGRIQLENTTLGELSAELKRYGDHTLEVSPQAAALRIGGSLQLSQTKAFIHSLPAMLPVKLIRNGQQVKVERRN